MDLIVAVSGNWGIGKDNGLLFSIPEDMKFFREKTREATVIMGRSTLLSLPGQKPLKGRVNVVMSTKPGYAVPGAIVVPDLDGALRAAEESRGPVFVIGGERVYRQLLPYCDRAYVTKVRAVPPADRFFPDLDAEPGWEIVRVSAVHEHEGLLFTFAEYANRDFER